MSRRDWLLGLIAESRALRRLDLVRVRLLFPSEPPRHFNCRCVLPKRGTEE